MKKALITGITGQDGSYLTELLLNKNYIVYGIIRPASALNRKRIDHIYLDSKYREKRLFLHYGDLEDSSSLNRIIENIEPEEIYNLGAQSHVKRSFEIPEYTAETNALGTLRLLDAIRNKKYKLKFYQASSSELFGDSKEETQSEETSFNPKSPYAVSKLFSYWFTKNYRDTYNLFACNGVLFNHESPRRGESFVTKKISLSVARIKYGLQNKLILGNLSAKRDWGYAKDYVEAMWLMLQHKKPDDYVIATGENHSVREFCEKAFNIIDINIEWQGSGINEKGINKKDGKVLIEVDPKYFRPAEVNSLCGNYKKSKDILNWKPSVKFNELVKIMVMHDLKIVKDLV